MTFNYTQKISEILTICFIILEAKSLVTYISKDTENAVDFLFFNFRDIKTWFRETTSVVDQLSLLSLADKSL